MTTSQVPTKLQIKSPVAWTWADHRDRWNNCRSCNLCSIAIHKVLARGTLPCDVLFIGEAPGEQEDILARPFVGPAGRILQGLLEALDERLVTEHRNKQTPIKWTWAITNIVACKPFKTGDEITVPPKESVEACHPRLIEFITNIARPRILIFLGKEAEKRKPAITKQIDIDPARMFSVWHPSYILRKGGLNSLEFKRTLLSLARFLKAGLT